MKTAIITVGVLAVVGVAAFLMYKPNTTKEAKGGANLENAAFIMGDEKAPVTMLDISNYTCVHCSRHANDILAKIISDYVDTGKVRLAFQDFTNNPMGFKASEAASCANDQGKFLDFHYALFRSFSELTSQTQESVGEFLKGLAPQFGLDSAAFDSCLDTGKYTKKVTKATQNAQDIGLTGTPFFVIGEEKFSGEKTYPQWQEYLDAQIEKATKASKEKDAPSKEESKDQKEGN